MSDIYQPDRYTPLGHKEAGFTEPLFLQHLLGGIQVAAGPMSADFKPKPKRP